MLTLTVVNRMLATMGEAPLNSLTDSHSFLGAAQDTLDRVNREVQAVGYWFNLETLSFTPNPIDDSIYLPGDTLEVRSCNRNYVARGNRLYNLDGGTYEFTSSMTLTVLRLVDFEQLPEIAAAYIAAVAVADFQINYDGDTAKGRKLEMDVARALVPFNKTDTRNRQVNLIDSNSRLQRLKLITKRARQNHNSVIPS